MQQEERSKQLKLSVASLLEEVRSGEEKQRHKDAQQMLESCKGVKVYTFVFDKRLFCKYLFYTDSNC